MKNFNIKNKDHHNYDQTVTRLRWERNSLFLSFYVSFNNFIMNFY